MSDPTETSLPGIPLSFGFDTWRRVEDIPELRLSPEAQERIRRKIASVEHARRVAMASSQNYVIGALRAGADQETPT